MSISWSRSTAVDRRRSAAVRRSICSARPSGRGRVHAELELRVGEEDPGARGDGRGVAIQGDGPVADDLGDRPATRGERPRSADVRDHPVEVDVLVVLALLGLGRRA